VCVNVHRFFHKYDMTPLMCARQPHSICFTDFLRGGRSLLWVSFDVYTFLLHALMSVHNTMTDNNVCETTQFQYARSAPLEITRNDILREAQDTFTCVTRLISMRDSPHFIFCKRNRMPVYFSSIFCLVFDVVLYVHHKSLILIRVIRLNFLMCDTSQFIRVRRLDYLLAGIGVFYVVHTFLRYVCAQISCWSCVVCMSYTPISSICVT